MEAQAALCDIRFKLQLGIAEVAIENIRDRYREQLHWESTVMGIIQTIESEKHKTVSKIVKQMTTWYDWQVEHERTVEFNRILREIIMLEDPSMLPYKERTEIEEEDIFGEIHKVFIDGNTDDCREITHQFAAAQPVRQIVITKSVVTFTDSEPKQVSVTVHFCDHMNMIAAARYLDNKYDIAEDTQDEDGNYISMLRRQKTLTFGKGEIEVVDRVYATTITRKVITVEMEEVPEAVEPAGPEYYFSQAVKIEEEPKTPDPKEKDKEKTEAEEMKYHFDTFSHVAKLEHQLKGTESNYESLVLRKPMYHENEGFQIYGTSKSLGKILLGVMKIVWSKMNEQSIVSYMVVSNELGPKQHPDGYVTRAKDPYHSLPKATFILKKHGYIKFVDLHGRSIEKEGAIDPKYRGDVYLQSLISGPGCPKTTKYPIHGHDMRQLGRINYDVDLGNFRGAIEPQKYMRYGVWHTRIGVLMNPINNKMPYFVPQDWEPETEYDNYSVIKEDRVEEWSMIVGGGIPFHNSAQLHPPHSADYDPSGQFSLRTEWSKVISTAFLARLYSGNLSQKWVVTNAKGREKRFSNKENAQELHQYYLDEETMAFYEFNEENKNESEFYENSLIEIREPGTRGGVCTYPSSIYYKERESSTPQTELVYKRQAWMTVKLPKGSYDTNQVRRIVLFVDIQVPKTKSGDRIQTKGKWLTKTTYNA